MKKRFIDVDVVIDKINTENQNNEMTREKLAQELGVHSQLFVKWKNQHTNSKLYTKLDKLSELSGMTYEEMIQTKEVNDEK